MKKRNTAFVSFIHRKDAEKALNELQDFVFEGSKLTICWGKPVLIRPSKGSSRVEESKPKEQSRLLDDGIKIEIPADKQMRQLIDSFSKIVSKEGESFEKVRL